MKITTTEGGVIQLEEVFNDIVLRSSDGEELSICMRDSGFEFNYEGERYFAKEGKVDAFHKPDNVKADAVHDQVPSPEMVACNTCNVTKGLKGEANFCNMCDHYY